MAGKTNTKQICVFKTQKVLIEFMDDTRYESTAMAWPHSTMSRIRINVKDYSKGTGDLAVDAFYNLSPEEFHRLHNAVLKAKLYTTNDFNRCQKHLERLQKIKKGYSKNVCDTSSFKDIKDLALQFKTSENELFSEAGEQIETALEKISVNRSDDNIIDSMITECEAELDEIKKSRELFSDIKMLNYDKYANPENPEERRITSFKVVFNPKMNYPYSFTVSNGWGVPYVLKQKGVLIKEDSARFVSTVNICIDEKNLLPMLKRVEVFLQAMTTHGLNKYFETVTNPILYNEVE